MWRKKQNLNTVSYIHETEMHWIEVVVFSDSLPLKKQTKKAKMNDLVTFSSTDSPNLTFKNPKQRIIETQQRSIYVTKSQD